MGASQALPTEDHTREDPVGGSPTAVSADAADANRDPRRKLWYRAFERRPTLWTAILCVSIVLISAVIIVGVNWQVYHRSEHLTLGGAASSVYRENLTFPWESQVTIQVEAPSSYVYGFFGSAQGIGYEGSEGACETLQSNGNASCTLNYSGGGFEVYVEDMSCSVGSQCGSTRVNLTFSYGAL